MRARYDGLGTISICFQRSASENLVSDPIFKIIISVLVKKFVLLTVLAAVRQACLYLNVYTRQ